MVIISLTPGKQIWNQYLLYIVTYCTSIGKGVIVYWYFTDIFVHNISLSAQAQQWRAHDVDQETIDVDTPLDILLEYWIEHITVGLLYVMFTFPSRIFYRGVPGFATDCPCGVWCHGLTTCLLYVGLLIFISQIVLYFLQSTSVLSFYLDVVLTLSILTASRYLVYMVSYRPRPESSTTGTCVMKYMYWWI